MKIANVVLGLELILVSYWLLDWLRDHLRKILQIVALALVILVGVYNYSEYVLYGRSQWMIAVEVWASRMGETLWIWLGS